MLTELLSIKPILQSFTSDEEERQRRTNKVSTDSIVRQLKEQEMECSNCCEYYTTDVYSLMKHEQKCEEISDEDFETANDVLLSKGFVKEIRGKMEIHKCDRCERVFKNKYLLHQHNTRGKNPNACLRVYMNNLLKKMDDKALMDLKELMKDNLII